MYYSNLYKIVSPHLKHFRTDLVQHDKKVLLNYTGEFIYTFTHSSTFIFLVDELFNALNEVLNTGKSDYFTPRGLKSVFSNDLHITNFYSVASIEYHYSMPTGFSKCLHGKSGRIKMVSQSEMTTLICSYQSRIDNIIEDILKKHPLLKFAS